MDALNKQLPSDLGSARAWMPLATPSPMPVQALDKPYRDPNAPTTRSSRTTFVWRALAFLPALLSTIVLMSLFLDWFSDNGLSTFEGIVIGLMGFTFFWISLSVSTALLGVMTLVFSRLEPVANTPVKGMNVALLVPIYNEDVADVFGNVAAMLAALNEQSSAHCHDLFILSDTRDDEIAHHERVAFAALRKQFPAASGIYYRRRDSNVDRKIGNLNDWISHWGSGYQAMLILDADSLMSATAIVHLSDALAADPSAGLIQTFPMLFGAQTLFGRVQQFSNRVYSAALSEGLARWADREGNYWGHNAIIRTSAFINSAGLPRISKRRSAESKLILSHDFVEAGMLRRAGWAVRFLPRITGSYEEVPATLIDYVLRDRRWCQGNLQHLSLLGTRGFHAVTRFHLFSGAMSYLASPAWFALLLVWALASDGQKTSAIKYFSGYDPQVSWPSMTSENSTFILLFIYGMLLLPKLIGVVASGLTGIKIRDMGGLRQFISSTVLEICLSFLYAPIMMVQQTMSVARTWLGFRESWTPQQRRGGKYSIAASAKFHLVETVIGALMLIGMLYGLVSPWLLPIAVSLVAAIALSALSGLNLSTHHWLARQLATPEHLNAPDIIQAAMAERVRCGDLLAQLGRSPHRSVVPIKPAKPVVAVQNCPIAQS